MLIANSSGVVYLTDCIADGLQVTSVHEESSSVQ